MKTQIAAMAIVALTLSPPSVWAEAGSEKMQNEKQAAEYKPDNTGRNARDVNENRMTADEQKLSGNDTELLAQIRRNVVANDSLSINGKNVKIMVESNTVILRGPVKSVDEKQWIEQEVNRTAKGYTVVNELEVAPS